MAAALEQHSLAPWRLFDSHRREAFPFLIDRGGAARPCFAGSRPRSQLRIDADGSARVWRDGRWSRSGDDPLHAIESYVEENAATPRNLPPWLEGEPLPRTVGFLGYELGAWTEGARAAAFDAVGTPLAILSTYDSIDAWDPIEDRRARIVFEGAAAGEDVPPRNSEVPRADPLDSDAWTSTPRDFYRRGFERIRAAIAAGEIYQANLSRRAVFDLDEDPAEAYARFRDVQPVPWGAFLDFGGFALLSNSPECFLERRGSRILTRPIKGTRPRRSNADADRAEREALLADPKERAEHLMIVDLERNDLGRVARTGSVEVSQFAVVESYATVHHLVSEVRAELREDTGLSALLRATFPGGSITGAPKIRAMEILAEVEAATRGPYTGSIGFFNGGDRIELSIAIRTAVMSRGRAMYSTGGGIVADSDPDREWDETELKLDAFRRAIEARPVSTTD
jgi:para-aminobenzoate synthetase component 1